MEGSLRSPIIYKSEKKACRVLKTEQYCVLQIYTPQVYGSTVSAAGLVCFGPPELFNVRTGDSPKMCCIYLAVVVAVKRIMWGAKNRAVLCAW